jgi:hypothetical protein
MERKKIGTIKKGILENVQMVVLNGTPYYASYSISTNYRYKRNALHSSTDQRRMFDRFEEATKSVVIKGITYYALDLEKRGW